MSNLLHINQLRGADSTGVVAVFNDGDVSMLKTPVDASTMMMYANLGITEYREIQQDLLKTGKAFLGHNRKATIGKVNVNTAHPFVVDNRFFFMHNGTLRNHKKLAGGNAYEVDSEALANHLVFCDTPEELQEALGEVEGAYACQWYDQDKHVIKMVRNMERPLFLAETNSGLMWASEEAFIYAAAIRNKIKIVKVKEVPIHTLMTIDLETHEVKGVALTVKKSTPLTTTTPGAVNKPVNVAAGKVSKSYFKKLTKRLTGTRLNFWIDDYVERHYPNDFDEWIVWGTNEDDFNFPHRISTVMKVRKSELENCYDGALVSGLVTLMDYNDADSEVIIRVEQVKKVLC